MSASQRQRSGQQAPPAVTVRHAAVTLDGTPVLHDVSFDVAAGEVVAIMGANGSGKSTLLRALLGILPLRSGEITVHGTPLRSFRQWRRLGYVPQRLAVGGGVPATVLETVLAGRLAHKWGWPYATARDRAAVDRALEEVDLAGRAQDAVAALSGGQQQRVLIARALATEPDTLLMDEPMAGVDAANQRALAHSLATLAGRGHTVVLVLHELGPLEPLVNRAVVLAHGRVVHDGAPPRPVGECAQPGHDHVHPHAQTAPAGSAELAVPGVEGPQHA